MEYQSYHSHNILIDWIDLKFEKLLPTGFEAENEEYYECKGIGEDGKTYFGTAAFVNGELVEIIDVDEE